MAVTADWREHYHDLPVLVLGATGFIGRRVAARLEESGARVTRAVRPPGVPGTVAIDLAVAGAPARVVETLHPAVTFNLAGYGVLPDERDAELADRLNRALPEELAAICGGAAPEGWPGLHLVHAGSALEYGTASGNLTETTPPLPTTQYGQTKLEGTRAVAAAVGAGRLRAATARLFTVYGPGEAPGRLLPTLLHAATHRDPIPLTAGAQRRDFTFVDDVVEGMLRLATLPEVPGAVVNLATGTLTPVREFITRAAARLGIAPERLLFGALPTRAEEMAHDPVAIDRLVALTGWRPGTTIEEGVARATAEWTGG